MAAPAFQAHVSRADLTGMSDHAADRVLLESELLELLRLPRADG